MDQALHRKLLTVYSTDDEGDDYKALFSAFNLSLTPSPCTRTHGPPRITLSPSPFSFMKVLTVSSSAPGWSQSAGTSSSLACCRRESVIFPFLFIKQLSLRERRKRIPLQE